VFLNGEMSERSGHGVDDNGRRFACGAIAAFNEGVYGNMSHFIFSTREIIVPSL
jgi:hypothetical protein